MARASEQEQKGSTGVSEVTAKFTRLGWGFAEITRHDNGSDLFLMARDARRFDLGLTVGAQVKAGPSYFKEAERDTEDRLRGWWFRDTDSEHVTDWLRHGLPHLVVIHDLESQVSYWVHVTEDAVVPTGKGSKILIPVGNTVDEANREALLAVASSVKPPAMWEGSVWQGVGSLPAKDTLRYALLVPRLIAPHPNARPETPVTAVQGVALLMQARIRDLELFAEEHIEVPTMHEALTSDEWTWRFFGALAQRVTTGDVDVLQVTLQDAPDAPSRVAATVTAVAGLLEEDRPDEAIALLRDVLEEDFAEPVDHAWLTVQYARALAEVGRLDEAKTHAASVQGLRATHPEDVTATALAGVAAQLLFSVSDWGERDVASAVMGADTAASWWRQQTRSWGLAASLERTFQGWARDTTRRWAVSDTANDQLLAASLTATLAGARDTWRDLTGLLGRDALIRLNRRADPAAALAGLASLRLTGDESAVNLAVARLVSDGPSIAVTEAARQIDLTGSTKTTGPANLTLLKAAAGVLDVETADRTVSWLLASIRDPAAFIARTTPSYLVLHRLVETLAAVVSGASPELRRQVVDHVLQLPAVDDQLMAQTWSRVVHAVSPDWSQADVDRITHVSPDHHDSLRLPMQGVASRFEGSVRTQLLEAIRSGSSDALGHFGDVRDLPSDVVEAYIATRVANLAEIASSAKDGTFGVRASDPADDLVLLYLWHGESADWASLTSFLADAHVSGRDKVRALRRLANQVDQIPAEVRSDLAVIAARLSGAKASPVDSLLGDPSVGGAAALLSSSLAMHGNEEAAIDLHRLLGRDAAERTWAARVAARRGGVADVGVLTTLVHDDSPEVRAAAGVGLALLVGTGQGDVLAQVGLRVALTDPGLTVPLAVARRLASVSELSELGLAALDSLRAHAHDSVRRAASEAVLG